MMRRRFRSRFVLKTVIYSVIYVALYTLFRIYFEDIFLDFFSDTFTLSIRYYYYEYGPVAAVVLYVVVIFFTAYRSISRAQKYFNLIYENSEKVLSSDEEIDTLPNDLKDIEVRLKDIKYSVFRNEKLAKEAEQRKNDLVVYLAHDLKTPLTSVIGYLSLLEECPELPVELRAKYTSIALDKAYRLEQLINEFFDITRFNLQSITLEKNRIDLNMMLTQMLEEFYPALAEKKLSPRTELEAGIRIIGDADKLARVFDNLLRNAVSYSYPDTEVYIISRTDGDFAEVVFRNKGDEIPQQKLESIFEKFFRVDASRSTMTGGAGLGLAIAKQIVELHGGTISAASSTEYTEFTVRLPKKLINI